MRTWKRLGELCIRYGRLTIPLLSFKLWTPLFNGDKERLDEVPIWVKLPSIPFNYWDVKFVQNQGNSLGKYLDHDSSYIASGIRTIAQILVLLDLRKGLLENIDIE